MAGVLIYGAGAIGSFLGYLLSEENGTGQMIEDVALLGRESHMKKIREMGLRIHFPDGSRCIQFRHCFSSLEEMERSDFTPEIVIICVKTRSLPGVCDELMESGILDGRLKEATFLLLMNGMGNREVFEGLNLPSDRIYEGITSLGVVFPEDGSIELKGRAKTVIEDRIAPAFKEPLRQRFEKKGFEIEFASNFQSRQWKKLFVNSVINPITALTGEKNGIVLSPHLRSTVKRIVAECVSVARIEGIAADVGEVIEFVDSVAVQTAANTSSMLQDVRRGRETEIDSINGYVIRQAGEQGIDVPVNETLYALVKAMEGGASLRKV